MAAARVPASSDGGFACAVDNCSRTGFSFPRRAQERYGDWKQCLASSDGSAGMSEISDAREYTPQRFLLEVFRRMCGSPRLWSRWKTTDQMRESPLRVAEIASSVAGVRRFPLHAGRIGRDSLNFFLAQRVFLRRAAEFWCRVSLRRLSLTVFHASTTLDVLNRSNCWHRGGEFFAETHVSTESAPSPQDTRFSRAHED
jgi:hypothetical protein